MISIICSTYNRAERVIEAIKSVQNQTFTDWEMIVVDDASTDNTQECILSHIEKTEETRVTYIRREKNFGNDTKPKNE